MKRVLLLAILVCSGCASAGGDNLVADSWWGDLAALFSPDDHTVQVSRLTGPPAYSGNVVPATAPASQPTAPATNP
jgi:hypothetical protein